MLNNIGLPGLLLSSLYLLVLAFGIYSLVKIPNSDERYNYAGFLRRLLAAVVDAIVLTLITLPLTYALGHGIGVMMVGTAPMYVIQQTAGNMGGFLTILIGWLYFAMMESSRYQATLGKKLFGLRVVDMNGGQIGFGKASGRHFGKFISFLTQLVGFFMAGWTKQKQGLHDKMAGCLVVRVNGPSQQFIDRTNSNALPKVERNIAAQAVNKNVDFEVEAMRRYKAGDISEQTFLEIMKPK